MIQGFFEEVKATLEPLYENEDESEDKNNQNLVKKANKKNSYVVKIKLKEKPSSPKLTLFGGYSQLDGLFFETGLGMKKYNFNTNVSLKIASLMKIFEFYIDNNGDQEDILYGLKIFFMSDKRKSKGNKNDIKIDKITDMRVIPSEDFESFCHNK